MYKAIFIDIDGTLRNNKREVTKRTMEAVKKTVESGILVVICSGRPRKYTEDVSRKACASNYIISSNGCSIYDYAQKQVLYENIMDKKACVELYKISEQSGIRFIMNVGDGRVVSELHSKDNLEEKLSTDIETFVNNNNVVQCTLADSDFEKMKNLRTTIEQVPNVAIKNQHKSLVNPEAPKEGSIYYDVSNVGINKGTGIKRFCEILKIDLKSALDEKKLDARILRDFEEVKNKQFKNSLEKLLPQKLIPVIIQKSNIQPDKKVNEITKKEREELVKMIKNFEITIKGFRPIEEAIITSGGINIKEINPKTMESKKVKGLYFAGEIIDVDSYTGGFNLQIAYSTGYVAGL